MTNEQLVAILAPMSFNGAIIGLAVLWMKAKFDAIDKRFNDMKRLWREELRRVEEVLDAPHTTN